MATAMLGAAAIAGAALVPSDVTAHANYERSQPAADAVVRSAPAQVDVWFTQEMFRRAGENALGVVGPSGERVSDGDAVLDDRDRTHLSVALIVGLGPGEYVVSWRTLSAVDGDTAEAEFRFTVDPSAPIATATPEAEAGTNTSDRPGERGVPSILAREGGASFPWWLVLAGAAVAASTALTVRALHASDDGGPGPG